MDLSNTALYVMLALGIVLLIVGSLFIWFFLLFKNRKKETKESFELVTGKYKIFQFWQFYAFIIVIFASYIGAVILLAISIGGLV